MATNSKKDYFWREFKEIPDNCYVSKRDLSYLKCLFVYLYQTGDFSKNDYPISFGYMTSILRMNGATADIIIQDINLYDKRVYDGYDMVSFFPMVALLRPILEVVSKVKNDYPKMKTCLFNSEQHQHEMVLCTPDAIRLSENILREYPSVDFILIGEAESAFLKLCENLINGLIDFSNVPACFYRKSNEIKISIAPIQPVNFEHLPFPTRDFLENGISDDGINTFSPRIQSSRGCLSPCTYCIESSSNITTKGRKTPWLGRNIDRFVDEIEYLSKEYKVVFFNVIDSSFEDPGAKGIARMRIFCNEIISRRIKASFKIHLRVETINKLDDKYLGLLKEAGIDILVIGVESSIERELKSYRKITTTEKNLQNIKRLDNFDKFFPLLGHMMFSPVLRLEDMYEKADYLKTINRCWDFLNMTNNVLVFRGTAYHQYLAQKHLTKDCDNLSGVIPYRYEDERVEILANEIGSLKLKLPEATVLNNLLYDSQNMIARYHNNINRHLWVNQKNYLEFKYGIDNLLEEVGDIYYSYFKKLVRLAEKGWSNETAKDIYKKWVYKFIPGSLKKGKMLLFNFTEGFKRAGLSTDKLYLKTWMSLINQINTSGGEIS